MNSHIIHKQLLRGIKCFYLHCTQENLRHKSLIVARKWQSEAVWSCTHLLVAMLKNIPEAKKKKKGHAEDQISEWQTLLQYGKLEDNGALYSNFWEKSIFRLEPNRASDRSVDKGIFRQRNLSLTSYTLSQEFKNESHQNEEVNQVWVSSKRTKEKGIPR